MCLDLLLFPRSRSSSWGRVAVLQFGGPVEVIFPFRLPDLPPDDSICSRSSGPRPVLLFRFVARPEGCWSSGPWSSAGGSSAVETGGVLFLRQGRLLDSSCMTFLETVSSSAGRESISVRIMAQASSTRSMALSGRNRSVMYLFDSTPPPRGRLSRIFTPWWT